MVSVMSRSDILQDIVSSARMHHQTLPESGPSRAQSQSDPDIPPLALSEQTEILRRKMMRHGVPSQVCTATMAKAAEVMAVYQASYASSCRHLMATVHPVGTSTMDSIQSLRRTMEHLYEHKNIADFFSTALKSKSLFSAQTSELEPRERKPFNNQFTPYLEAYLEQNAFPSIADQKSLAEKGGMDHSQIVTWFQNRRSRARKYGKEAALKRLPPGQIVNVDLIEQTIRSLNDDTSDEGINSRGSAPCDVHLDLDHLAHAARETIPIGFEIQTPEPCVSDADAFRLPTTGSQPAPQSPRRVIASDDLSELLSAFSIRTESPSISEVITSKPKGTSKRRAAPKVIPKMKPLKATLRSCFSAAVTLTCPRSHPALIRKEVTRSEQPRVIDKSTILEQKHVPVKPYTLPAVLPSWNLPVLQEPDPVVRRKKPTISSHEGKLRPGSPYPKQTISRMSSTSSLASMASFGSQSSSRSSSSTFSSSTVESSEISTPVQSPGPDNAKLVDSIPFGDDIFGDYFFQADPIPDNFFDINVDQPFDNDVSLSFPEFDKTTSLSIAEFDITTLPSFDFFES